MEIIENVALITINETLLFQLVSFLIFLFLFNRIMIRPLRNTIEERKAFLELMEQDIASADQDYDSIARQIKKEEAAAKKEAYLLRDKLETEGQKTASELIEKTKHEISLMRQKAQKDTEAQIDAARREVRKEVEAISDQMITVLLGRRSPT